MVAKEKIANSCHFFFIKFVLTLSDGQCVTGVINKYIMKMFLIKIRIFSWIILVLFGFSFNLSAQSIQPLGIKIGNYSISPGKAASINTYCIDRHVLTEIGTLYTQISIGRNTLISVDKKEYLLQDAIDRGYVSFTYEQSVNEQMKMSIKNHTNSEVKLNVKEDLVLSDVPDGQNIKSTFALNTNVAQYKIPRQQVIWFSHFFHNYFDTYSNMLFKNGIIKSYEEVSVEGYLKKRDQFLKTNGITDRTLIAKHQSKDLEIDYTIDKLLSTKEDVINLYNDTGLQLYILRFVESADDNYYYLENGSSMPFKTQSIIAVTDKIRASKSDNATIIINRNVPAVKQNLLIQSFKNIGIPIISEISELGYGSVIPFIAKEPNIVSVSDVGINSFDFDVLKSYSFKIKYRVQANNTYLKSAENFLEVESTSKGYLTVMSTWFKSLLGKANPSKNMAEIYKESKKVADRAFTGRQTKVQISSNFSSIQYSDVPIKLKNLFFLNKNLYAYN